MAEIEDGKLQRAELGQRHDGVRLGQIGRNAERIHQPVVSDSGEMPEPLPLFVLPALLAGGLRHGHDQPLDRQRRLGEFDLVEDEAIADLHFLHVETERTQP